MHPAWVGTEVSQHFYHTAFPDSPRGGVPVAVEVHRGSGWHEHPSDLLERAEFSHPLARPGAGQVPHTRGRSPRRMGVSPESDERCVHRVCAGLREDGEGPWHLLCVGSWGRSASELSTFPTTMRCLAPSGGVLRVGRSMQPNFWDVLVVDPVGRNMVSREHFVIREGPTLVNHSRAGTLVNGTRVWETMLLRDGDMVGIPSAPAPATPENPVATFTFSVVAEIAPVHRSALPTQVFSRDEISACVAAWNVGSAAKDGNMSEQKDAVNSDMRKMEKDVPNVPVTVQGFYDASGDAVVRPVSPPVVQPRPPPPVVQPGLPQFDATGAFSAAVSFLTDALVSNPIPKRVTKGSAASRGTTPVRQVSAPPIQEAQIHRHLPAGVEADEQKTSATRSEAVCRGSAPAKRQVSLGPSQDLMRSRSVDQMSDTHRVANDCVRRSQSMDRFNAVPLPPFAGRRGALRVTMGQLVFGGGGLGLSGVFDTVAFRVMVHLGEPPALWDESASVTSPVPLKYERVIMENGNYVAQITCDVDCVLDVPFKPGHDRFTADIFLERVTLIERFDNILSLVGMGRSTCGFDRLWIGRVVASLPPEDANDLPYPWPIEVPSVIEDCPVPKSLSLAAGWIPHVET